MSTGVEGAGSVGPDCGRRGGEPIPEPPSPTMPRLQSKMSPKTPDRDSPSHTGACFTCKREGHWSRDCPSKKSPAGQLGAGGLASDVPDCDCGKPCAVLTSWTERNPGRKFFKCSLSQSCKFFQWCDSPSPCWPHGASPVQQRANSGSPIKQQEGNTSQGNLHPTCECGAGWCIILTWKEGRNRDRKYFSCPRQKCDFFRWCDEFNLTGKCMGSPTSQHLESHTRSITHIQYPECECGAGSCRLLTMEDGDYAGRKYFGCHVRKGDGACGFFQWQNPADGNHENGKSPFVGSRIKDPNSAAMNKQRDDKPFEVEPTLLNFDDTEVEESNARSGGAYPAPHFEQCQGDAGAPSNQSGQLNLHNRSPNASLKLGTCYRCGKEGHWEMDCVERLPSSRW